ncbi:MAG: zinc ABC transporter substrate-binding protein [Acidimicrobiia bacterium]|nr:zinc ABC transporter substrate-binding protein [Acidimicrobiia bacterium]
METTAWRTGLTALVACTCGLAACTGPSADSTDGPLVIATTSIIGDVVSSIVGDAARVEVLIPAGSDPHSFEPSAREIASLREASVIVAIGSGLEAGLASPLISAADDGTPVVELIDVVQPLLIGTGDHDHDDNDEHGELDEHQPDDGHEHGDEDPHFWHDPLRMADVIPALVDAIVEAEPTLDTTELSSRAAALVEELRALDAEIVETLAAVPSEHRFLVTNHDTFGYFAARYDFEVIGAVIPGGDTLAETNPADLSHLIDEVEAHGLPAIFSESSGSAALSNTLVDGVDHPVEVVELFTDSLGPPGSGADTYVGMLRTNAERVAEALA